MMFSGEKSSRFFYILDEDGIPLSSYRFLLKNIKRKFKIFYFILRTKKKRVSSILEPFVLFKACSSKIQIPSELQMFGDFE